MQNNKKKRVDNSGFVKKIHLQHMGDKLYSNLPCLEVMWLVSFNKLVITHFNVATTIVFRQ